MIDSTSIGSCNASKDLVRLLNELNDEKITKKVFEGREYFKVEDKIFVYTITFKNGIPKIMYINHKIIILANTN